MSNEASPARSVAMNPIVSPATEVIARAPCNADLCGKNSVHQRGKGPWRCHAAASCAPSAKRKTKQNSDPQKGAIARAGVPNGNCHGKVAHDHGRILVRRAMDYKADHRRGTEIDC
jgi:hypothetical protein